MELLSSPKSTDEHKSFTYYGKDIIIPNVGDIISATFADFSTYYILVTRVYINEGKNGTIFQGYQLKQKLIGPGSYTPALLKSRDDFKLTNIVMNINPKDKSRIMDLEIQKF